MTEFYWICGRIVITERGLAYIKHVGILANVVKVKTIVTVAQADGPQVENMLLPHPVSAYLSYGSSINLYTNNLCCQKILIRYRIQIAIG
jgi:hypothetical protein